MGLRGLRRCGGAARGAGVYLLAETGGKPVVWGWPPMPEDGRLIMMEEQWIKSKPQWNGCVLRRRCR